MPVITKEVSVLVELEDLVPFFLELLVEKSVA